MVKIVSLALVVASLAAFTSAQEPESSVSSSEVAPASTSSAPVASSTSATSSSSSSSTPSSSSSTASAAPSSGAGGAQVCSILVGDPRVHPADCTFSSTYTPPYDESSLIDYLIGSYGRASVQATPVDVVATQLAGEVLKLYPTQTVSKADLAGAFEARLSASIEGVRNGNVTIDDGALPANSLSYAAVFAAVIAGGAFIL